MKKQHVFLLVFLILALGISGTVFLVARGQERARKSRDSTVPIGTPVIVAIS